MKIVDMYQKVVAVVCQTTGIDEYSMFHSNKEVCVDARSFVLCKGCSDCIGLF